MGLEIFYLIIDLCLLFGLLAIYLSEAEKFGWLGFTSFGVAAIGLASIVGPDASLSGIDLYQLGVTVLTIGLAGLSFAMLRAGIMKSAALYWIGALGFGAMSTAAGSMFIFAIAGVSFALGFVSAGVSLALKLEEA